MDRMLKQPTGKIALDVTPSKLNHKSMGGVYKKYIKPNIILLKR